MFYHNRWKTLALIHINLHQIYWSFQYLFWQEQMHRLLVVQSVTFLLIFLTHFRTEDDKTDCRVVLRMTKNESRNVKSELGLQLTIKNGKIAVKNIRQHSLFFDKVHPFDVILKLVTNHKGEDIFEEQDDNDNYFWHCLALGRVKPYHTMVGAWHSRLPKSCCVFS